MNPVASLNELASPAEVVSAPSAAQAAPWTADLGDGRYRNPVLWADYSDPDVVRVGDEYFMTASSFNCTPGLPILRSRDLVNWRLVNHAVQNLPHPRFDLVQPGCGVWAPAIRHHQGKFWIFFAMPDEGIFVVTATDPCGRWSEPRLVQAGRGLIDPCPLWDDDGQAYLVSAFAFSRSGVRHRLQVARMAPDASCLLDEGRIVYEDPEKHPTIEGPKFFKFDDWYYILAPAGGVDTGWQTALRSRSVFGPYEDRVVLAQGETAINGPHQGGLVDATDGSWWFLHFQDAGVYGRVVHLQPVEWRDGWPLMGRLRDPARPGEPVADFASPLLAPHRAPEVPQTTDDFDSPALGLQWQWNANHCDDWCSLAERPGWLRLHAEPAPHGILSSAPRLLLQKFPAPAFAATTLVDLPQESGDLRAGLIVAGRSSAGILVSRSEGVPLIEQFVQDETAPPPPRSHGAAAAGLDQPTWLRVEVALGGLCQFSYSFDGREFIELGRPFPATAGHWIGARVGLAALGSAGFADFDFLRIE
ncbi:MAG: glycoside hydrolase 43 family protein [Pirellulales bacterium]|nr:glycoside hydrolase 43 family protein [Pirellulales bacterium]